MKEKEPPKIRFCPYCGAETLKHVSGTKRCENCRAAFNVSFSRYVRKSLTPGENK